MGATADSKVNPGKWVVDTGLNTWGAGAAVTTAAATFQYDSNIICDRRAQLGNPVLSPVPPGTKFAGGPPPAPLTTKIWGVFRKNHPGPAGSRGITDASGSGKVLANGDFEADSFARARAAAAAGGSARAISTVSDPWRFNYSATGDPKLHTVMGIALTLGGSLKPPEDVKASRSSIAIQGEMGSISVSVDGKSGRFRTTVKINPAWKAYIGRIIVRRREIPVPKAASVADIKNLLVQGFDPQTKAWRSMGRRTSITFVKDLGSRSGSIRLGMSVSAQEEAKGPAPYKPPYKP